MTQRMSLAPCTPLHRPLVISRMPAVLAGVCALALAASLNISAAAHAAATATGHAPALSGLSSGGTSSCALTRSQTVVCWGDDEYGQSDPASGKFKSVTVGSGTSSCGITIHDDLACWGSNARAPKGKFRMVAPGWTMSCGLTVRRLILCWSSLPPRDQPVQIHHGAFQDVSTGRHPCAVTTAEQLVCWGPLSKNLPKGKFVQVSVGSRTSGFACALRVDGKVMCWGNPQLGRTAAPPGDFLEIATSAKFACGVLRGGAIACWGRYPHIPTGSFTRVTAGFQFVCGTRVSGEVVCAGDNTYAQTEVPGSPFVQLSAYCGLRIDGSVSCWGSLSSLKLPGTFTRLTDWCATRQDNRVICFGHRSISPKGNFIQASDGPVGPTCGVTFAAAIRCWNGEEALGPPPQGVFTQVSVGGTNNNGEGDILFACALRLSATIACWGDGQLKPPRGRFLQVSANSQGACGVRWTHRLSCWGLKGTRWWTKARGSFADVDASSVCALRVGGAITCGSDASYHRSQPPWAHGHYVAIGGGLGDPCGVDSNGGVHCWGGTSVRIPSLKT